MTQQQCMQPSESHRNGDLPLASRGTRCLHFCSCSLVHTQVIGCGFVILPLCYRKALAGSAHIDGLRKRVGLFPGWCGAGRLLFAFCSLALWFCSCFSLECFSSVCFYLPTGFGAQAMCAQGQAGCDPCVSFGLFGILGKYSKLTRGSSNSEIQTFS